MQVALDHSDIGKYLTPDVGVVGSADRTADQFVHWLNEAEIPSSSFASPEMAAQLAAFSPAAEFTERRVRQVRIDLAQTLLAIDATVPAERVLVTDAGRHLLQPWKLVGVHHPSCFRHSGFWINWFGGSACHWRREGQAELPTLAIVGDGGFMLGGLAEFNTAVRNGSDLIVVVCNDRAYGAEHVQLRQRELDPKITMFEWPDFATLHARLTVTE